MDASSTNPEPITDRARVQAGFRYAVALTHHYQDAEDLVQEAWLNLCRRYGSVASNALLFTAVRNLFVDQCRRRKIVQFESLDESETPVWPGPDGEEPGLQGDLEALLGTLRPLEREVLFLHYYEGRTAEEIGQMTGHPRGSVLSLMHRALVKLRASAGAQPGAGGCNQRRLLSVFWM